jgi:hypothetical protein
VVRGSTTCRNAGLIAYVSDGLFSCWTVSPGSRSLRPTFVYDARDSEVERLFLVSTVSPRRASKRLSRRSETTKGSLPSREQHTPLPSSLDRVLISIVVDNNLPDARHICVEPLHM